MCRHHLCTDAVRLHVLGSDYGLVNRYVLAWQLSNTLDVGFCVHAVHQAFQLGQPSIFNTDQGAQFTARGFTATIEAAGIHVR